MMNRYILTLSIIFSLTLSQAFAAENKPNSADKRYENNFTYLGLRGGRAILDSNEFDSRLDETYLCYHRHGDHYYCNRNDDDDAAFYSVFGGKKIPNRPYRFEIEYTYIDGLDFIDRNASRVEVKSRRAMINLYYDYELNDSTFINIGLGGGMAKNRMSGKIVESSDDSEFAYALSLGMTWRVRTRVDLELGFRYVGLGDLNYTDSAGRKINDDLDSREVFLGVGYRF